LRYFIELSYNGKAYHGWQIQPNVISVQEILEKSLSILIKEPISTMGAGRTDAGVHAIQLFAHFDTEVFFDVKQLQFKLNSFLPEDISIQNIFKVKADAHARFHAISREYLYRIALEKNPFNREYAFLLKSKLDINKLKAATNILLEYSNFKCFSKSKTDVKTYHCNIIKAEWQLVADELHFTIKADRFLRNMVRAIVGTLINIGIGKTEVERLHSIIKSKNRSEAGFSVPAHALYLTAIEYPASIKDNIE